ncbi:MAG: hypothetical protein ACC661_08660, partial [Verrucomicrobiales bacterium]
MNRGATTVLLALGLLGLTYGWLFLRPAGPGPSPAGSASAPGDQPPPLPAAPAPARGITLPSGPPPAPASPREPAGAPPDTASPAPAGARQTYAVPRHSQPGSVDRLAASMTGDAVESAPPRKLRLPFADGSSSGAGGDQPGPARPPATDTENSGTPAIAGSKPAHILSQPVDLSDPEQRARVVAQLR